MKAKQGESLKSFINHRWHKMRERVSGHPAYKDIVIKITREQFASWVESQWPQVIELRSIGETPSIDRINPEGHYELSNMRIISFKTNAAMGRDKANKLRTQKKRIENPPKKCQHCNAIFDKRLNEAWWEFKNRKYCNRSCASYARTKNSKGQFI